MRTITNSGGLRRRAGYYCDRVWNFRKKTPKTKQKKQREFAASFVFKKKSLVQIKSKPVYISLFFHKYLKLDILQSIYNMWTGSYIKPSNRGTIHNGTLF